MSERRCDWHGEVDHDAIGKRIADAVRAETTKERDDLRAKLAEAEKTNSMLVGDNCELLKRAEAAEALAAKNDARAKLLLADREAAEARVRWLDRLEKELAESKAEITRLIRALNPEVW